MGRDGKESYLCVPEAECMSQVFDTSQLALLPLSERVHDLDISAIRTMKRAAVAFKELAVVADRIVLSKEKRASIVLMMGAHVLRSGVQRYLIDLMGSGYISCIATNGACIIHDFELALVGGTTESVARYIKDGKFGLWEEIGKINEIVKAAAQEGLGLGKAVGRGIENGAFPYKEVSIFAAGYRFGIPLTVHVGIGYDIVYEHPNCDGAAYGATSYLDFLKLGRVLDSLEGGVVMNFGSAVMAPEVYLKALAMARNVAKQESREIRKFTTLVCDLYPLPDNFHQEPPKGSPEYFFRPWKTMLVRTVADGGESFYVNGDHADTVPQLWTAIKQAERSKVKSKR